MKGQFLTDRGQIRQHNEDSGGIFFNRYDQFLAIIADGMGGHRAGDVASQMATNLMQEKWEDSDKFHSPDEVETWLNKTLKEINQAIFHHAMQEDECQGMGTTVVVAVCINEFVTIGHVGDSRCYILNEDGFHQVTEDHSLVNELVRSGELTKEDAEHHPRKNVLLKALGTEEAIDPDVRSISWDIDDQLLLCSDGLTNKVSDQELVQFLKSDVSIEETAKKLIDLANNLGGEDNISLVLVQHSLPEKEGDSAC